MSDRIVGILLLATSVWYGLTAGTFEGGYGDPLGPAALPRVLSVLAGLFSLYLIVLPDTNPSWPTGRPLLRQIAAITTLVLYALLIEEGGFILPTFSAVAVIALLFGAPWRGGLISALVTSVLLFVLFDVLLDVPLTAFPEFLS